MGHSGGGSSRARTMFHHQRLLHLDGRRSRRQGVNEAVMKAPAWSIEGASALYELDPERYLEPTPLNSTMAWDLLHRNCG